ncbi:hypothetical protein CR513_08526, partial [Mucuna pruriens]
MTATICKLKWIKNLLASLCISRTNPMQLHYDSQSTLHIAANPQVRHLHSSWTNLRESNEEKL